MKNILLGFSLLFIFVSVFAQAPEQLNFQAIIKNSANEVLADNPTGIRFTIYQDSINGMLIYQETQTASSNAYGLLNLNIGNGIVITGLFDTIHWESTNHFLKIEVDYDGGNNFSEMGIRELKSVPFALYSNHTGYSDSSDYANILNEPVTISIAQSAKLDSINIDEAVNLDTMANDILTNSMTTPFPGFGNTVGTAFEIYWSEVPEGLYYPTGNVGVSVPIGSDFQNAKLHVGGKIQLDDFNTSNTPNNTIYFYRSDTTSLEGSIGSLMQLSADGVQNSLVSEDSSQYWAYKTGLVPWPTQIQILQDGIIQNHLQIGSFSVCTDTLLENNTLSSKDSVNRVYFWDTSSSASFPGADWSIVYNDISENGEDYFSIEESSASQTAFKVMSGAPDNALYVSDDGDVGLGLSNPTEQLETVGTVAATMLIGNGSQLTGLPTGGTALTENVGSTTINSDSNMDNVGDIDFQTQNSTRLIIKDNGNIGINNINPTETLDIIGGFTTINSDAKLIKQEGILTKEIILSAETNGSVTYDASGKGVVQFEPTSSLTITSMANGVLDQEMTLINTGTANVILSFDFANYTDSFLPQGINVTLTPFSTATVIKRANGWLIVDKVN
jgi:hypothetical protein